MRPIYIFSSYALLAVLDFIGINTLFNLISAPFDGSVIMAGLLSFVMINVNIFLLQLLYKIFFTNKTNNNKL